MDFKNNIDIIENNFALFLWMIPVWIVSIVALIFFSPIATLILIAALVYFWRRFRSNNRDFVLEKSPLHAREIFWLRTQHETQKSLFRLFYWQVLITSSHTLLLATLYVVNYFHQQRMMENLNQSVTSFRPMMDTGLQDTLQTLLTMLVYYTFIALVLSLLLLLVFTVRRFLNRRSFNARKEVQTF